MKFLTLFLLLVIGACSSGGSSPSTVEENEEETTTVLFSNVNDIIAVNCANCHGLPVSNGAPMSLVSYDDIVESADLILVRINLPDSDPLSMPQNETNLSNDDIETIKNWIDAGMPNN